jgi:hypothetical protein
MRTSKRDGFAWLECLLVLSILVLVLQLMPWGAWQSAWAMMDLRNWTAGMWFCGNLLLFLGMLGIRIGPALRDEASRLLRYRRRRPAKQISKEDHKRQREERELYQRMIEARKKQVIG